MSRFSFFLKLFRRQASDTKTPPSSGQNYDGIRKRYDDIKKSQNDKRAYRGLVLDNEMKVLLISDPTTDKSAGSIAVKIGKNYFFLFMVKVVYTLWLL